MDPMPRQSEVDCEHISRKLDLLIGLLAFALWCQEQQRAVDRDRLNVYRGMFAALKGERDGRTA